MLNVLKIQSVNFEQIKKKIAFTTKLIKTEHIYKLAVIIQNSRYKKKL